MKETANQPEQLIRLQGTIADVQGSQEFDALAALASSIRYGEQFSDGTPSLSRADIDAKNLSEDDILFGLIIQVGQNVSEEQFSESVRKLGLKPGDTEAALSIISGEKLNLSVINGTDPRSTRSKKLRFARVAEMFEAGELTRREVIDRLVIDPLRTRETVDDVLTRAFGGLQAVGGAVEVKVGAALSATGLGAIIGVPLIALGADNVQSGVRQAVSGESTKSFLQLGLEGTGLSESNAAIASLLVNLGVGVTAGLAQAGKLGKLGGVPNKVELNSRSNFEFNSIENPGPLAEIRGTPAANFYAGRYNANTLDEDLILYRGGNGGGGRNAYGQWFTREAPESVAKVRIDTAVKEQWIDPVTGELSGTSPINAVYGIKIPKGTTIYEGPVASQGGVYLGSDSINQIFVPKPWDIKGHEIVFEGPLK